MVWLGIGALAACASATNAGPPGTEPGDGAAGVDGDDATASREAGADVVASRADAGMPDTSLPNQCALYGYGAVYFSRGESCFYAGAVSTCCPEYPYRYGCFTNVSPGFTCMQRVSDGGPPEFCCTTKSCTRYSDYDKYCPPATPHEYDCAPGTSEGLPSGCTQQNIASFSGGTAMCCP